MIPSTPLTRLNSLISLRQLRTHNIYEPLSLGIQLTGYLQAPLKSYPLTVYYHRLKF